MKQFGVIESGFELSGLECEKVEKEIFCMAKTGSKQFVAININ
jgi:hypothetical protein